MFYQAGIRDGGNGTFDNGTGDDVASGTTTSAATTGFSGKSTPNYAPEASTNHAIES